MIEVKGLKILIFQLTLISDIVGELGVVKGAFYSAAYMMQWVLADDLDVSPEEIELASITQVSLEDGSGRSVARIVLADELANGSGFVKHLFNQLDSFLKKCTDPDERDTYAYSFINEKHLMNCESATYDDLKTYRNLNYHGIMDLKLAIGLVLRESG